MTTTIPCTAHSGIGSQHKKSLFSLDPHLSSYYVNMKTTLRFPLPYGDSYLYPYPFRLFFFVFGFFLLVFVFCWWWFFGVCCCFCVFFVLFCVLCFFFKGSILQACLLSVQVIQLKYSCANLSAFHVVQVMSGLSAIPFGASVSGSKYSFTNSRYYCE